MTPGWTRPNLIIPVYVCVCVYVYRSPKDFFKTATSWLQGLSTKTSGSTLQIKTPLMEPTADMQEEGCVYCKWSPGGKIHKHTLACTNKHEISVVDNLRISLKAQGSCHAHLCCITHPVCVLLLPVCVCMCSFLSVDYWKDLNSNLPASQEPT